MRSYSKHSDCGRWVHASASSAVACASGRRNCPEIRRGSRVSRRVATHADMVRIEDDIQKATLKHNEFLKELGKRLLPTAERNDPI